MFPYRLRLDSTRANLVWAASIQVMEKLAGYAIIAVLTRTLATVDVGKIFFASTVSGIAATVVSFGTEHHLIRAVAIKPDRALLNLGEALSTRWQNLVMVYALVNLTFWFLQPELSPILLLVTAYDFLEEIYFCFAAFFTGQRKLIYRLGISTAVKLLTVVAIAAVAFLAHALYLVLFSYLLLDVGLVVITYWIVRRDFGPVRIGFDWHRNLGLMKASLPFFLFNILTIAHLRLDTLMVGVMLDLVQVAYYDLGMKMLEAARFLIRPSYSVFYPVFSGMAAAGQWKRLRGRAGQLTAAALALGVLIAVGMRVLGGRLILFLFGSGYEASILPAQILFFSTPLIFVYFVITVVANALHLERQSAWLLGISVFLNIALNIFIIPRYGIIGAAWTTLASQAFLTLSMVWVTVAKLLNPESV